MHWPGANAQGWGGGAGGAGGGEGEGGGGEGGGGEGGGGEGPAQGCLGSTAPAKRKLRP